MTILGLECSAVAASCAVVRDGALLCEAFSAVRLTHSQTLLVMAEDLLKQCGLTPRDVDAVAVAAGPGSFTGVRIGMAAAKGLPEDGSCPASACPPWRPWRCIRASMRGSSAR